MALRRRSVFAQEQPRNLARWHAVIVFGARYWHP
jgi:hypothetical protein